MRDLFLGILIGILLYGQAAKAIDITFDQVTLRDVYAACCLAGAVARYGDEWTGQQYAHFVWSVSSDILGKRPKR